MSESERSCGHCGAARARLDTRFCEYCGHEFPRPSEATIVTPPPAPPTARPTFGNLPTRFLELQRHAEFARLMAHRPSTAKPLVGGVFVLMIVAFISCVALFVASVSLKAGAIGLFGFFPGLFVGLIAVAGGIGVVIKIFRFANAPLDRLPAVVVDERTHVSGGEQSATTYYLTVEFANGKREEYETEGSICGTLRPGDIGIAYVKDTVLVEFARVAV